MTYKHIILNGQGVRVFKEAKPETTDFEYEYETGIYEPEDDFQWDERMYQDAIRAHEQSGIDIEFYPGEETKIKLAIFNVPASKQIGYDITDFCEIREAVCEAGRSGNKCPYILCQKDGYCHNPKLYAFFKAPVEKEMQEHNTNSEIGSHHWFQTLMGQVIRMGEFIEKNPNDKRIAQYEYGKKIKEISSFVGKNFRKINTKP